MSYLTDTAYDTKKSRDWVKAELKRYIIKKHVLLLHVFVYKNRRILGFLILHRKILSARIKPQNTDIPVKLHTPKNELL